jgi:hypothetical protein
MVEGSRLKNGSMGWRPFSRRDEYSFLPLLETALADGLIVGDFRSLAGEAISAFPVAKDEAAVAYAMEAVAREMDNRARKERLKTFQKQLQRLTADLRSDLDKLEPLRETVDDFGEVDDLDAVDEAIRLRKSALDAADALLILYDEPRLVPSTNSKWEERHFFRQAADWWRSHNGDQGERGIDTLCDVAAALWRDMGGEIREWKSKDNPEREWARSKLKPHLK